MGPNMERRSPQQLGTACGEALAKAPAGTLFSRHDLMQKWGALPGDEWHFFAGVRRALQVQCLEYVSEGSGVIRLTEHGQESVMATVSRAYSTSIAAMKTAVSAIDRMLPAAPAAIRPGMLNEQAQLAKQAQQTERMMRRWQGRWPSSAIPRLEQPDPGAIEPDDDSKNGGTNNSGGAA